MPHLSNDETSPEYSSFLRSGSYPINALSKTLGQYSSWVVRLGSMAAIAVFAGGSGYAMTQLLVPTHGAQIASAADLSPVESMQIRAGAVRRPSTPAHGARAASDNNGSSEHAERLDHGAVASASGRSNMARATINNGVVRRTSKRRSSDVAEVSVGASASPELMPVAGTSAELDILSQEEGLRTQLIADRVRALDEANAHAASANVAADDIAHVAHIAPDDVVIEAPDRPEPEPAAEEPLTAPAAVAAVAPTVSTKIEPEHAFEREAPIVKPNPSLHSNPVPRLPLRAAANIEDLSVKGSLSASNVRRGAERLRPQLAECYEHAARQARRNAFGRVEVSLTIDEAGRARSPRVQGAELPGLGSCLSAVTTKLVSAAPDTGVVRATIIVNFVP